MLRGELELLERYLEVFALEMNEAKFAAPERNLRARGDGAGFSAADRNFCGQKRRGAQELRPGPAKA